MKPRKQQKVAVAYPHPHEVSARFHNSLLMLMHYDMTSHGRIVEGGGVVSCSSGANITGSRNDIVRKFLDQHDADWLWFVDTDMVFDADILDRLVDAAHPTLRPILGALCFSLKDGAWACPTTYLLRDDGHVGGAYDLPAQDGPYRCLTGTGCLLIHRSVLEAMRGRFPKPYEWFQETHHGDEMISEDITFCIRAEASGFPVHVDTRIECGHEKPFVVGRQMYDAQRSAGFQAPVDAVAATYVVIPVKAGERDEMTANLLEQLALANVRVDDSDATITDKWNAGWEWAEECADGRPYNLAVLNNDLDIPPGFIDRLAAGLRQRDDHWIAYPNVHGLDIPDRTSAPTATDKLAGQTMSGYAFMVRGECGLRFDPQFRWWYGDSDLEQQVKAAGKLTACVGGCFVRHLDPMTSSKSAEMLAIIREDEARFAAKWGLEPRTLWLALNPDFGQQVTV